MGDPYIYIKVSSDATMHTDDWTGVTGKIFSGYGGDIYNPLGFGETWTARYRYTGVFTCLAMQLAIKTASQYSRDDFYRIVIEYEVMGVTKKS